MLAEAAVSVAMVNPNVGFNGQTVGDWIVNNIVFILIVFAAISIFVAANTKKVRDAFVTFGLCLLGMVLLVLASSWKEVGQWFVDTFLNG